MEKMSKKLESIQSLAYVQRHAARKKVQEANGWKMIKTKKQKNNNNKKNKTKICNKVG